jgi:cysteine synthase B
MAIRLSREEGLLIGISAGAAVSGCMHVAQRLRKDKDEEAVIVTVFPDSGDKYLSERFWTEAGT